jgi:hypothetical protein
MPNNHVIAGLNVHGSGQLRSALSIIPCILNIGKASLLTSRHSTVGKGEPCQRLSSRINLSALSIVRESYFRTQYKEDLLETYHDNYHYQR